MCILCHAAFLNQAPLQKYERHIIEDFSARLLGIRCHIDFCVTMYNEETLNPVQTWLSGFSTMCRYTIFAMASEISHRVRTKLLFVRTRWLISTLSISM